MSVFKRENISPSGEKQRRLSSEVIKADSLRVVVAGDSRGFLHIRSIIIVPNKWWYWGFSAPPHLFLLYTSNTYGVHGLSASQLESIRDLFYYTPLSHIPSQRVVVLASCGIDSCMLHMLPFDPPTSTRYPVFPHPHFTSRDESYPSTMIACSRFMLLFQFASLGY